MSYSKSEAEQIIKNFDKRTKELMKGKYHSGVGYGSDYPKKKYTDSNSWNLLRAVPLLLIIISVVVFFQYFQSGIYDLSRFAADVDIKGGYTSLYYITIPLFLLSLPIIVLKKSYMTILGNGIFCGLYPLAFGFAGWFWSFLGIPMLAIALMIAATLLSMQDNDDEATFSKGAGIAYGTIFTVYIAARIFGFFGNYTGTFDIVMVLATGAVMLRHSVTLLFTAFKWEGRDYSFSIYYSVPLVISLVFLAGVFIYGGKGYTPLEVPAGDNIELPEAEIPEAE